MRSFLHTVERILGIYRWHPKIALRYLPIADKIRRSKTKNPTVLEVGSGSLGIAPYLKQEVTGVDAVFNQPSFPLLRQVIGTAVSLPFSDNYFDFVLLVDVLEHLSKNDRKKAVSEAIRVASKEVVVAVPCGAQAENQDKKLSKIYKEKYKESFDFLKEHITFGLPKDADIKLLITNAAKEYNKRFILQVKGNINLSVRKFLMKGWMTKSLIIDIFFRKVFFIFIPLLRLCNFKPTYRKIFFVQFRNNADH